MNRRRDINSLSQQELDDYVHALKILRHRSKTNPDDPTGYEWQARLHNDGEVGPCEHGNDLFFAWHRCHLYYFEQLLQTSDPPRTANVTIPYWDWSRPDPAGGRYPQRFMLNEALVATRLADGMPLAGDTVKIVKAVRTWNEFGGWPKGTPDLDYGAFENGPHNYTHGNYIGGLMGNPETAAEDPIYFSFHCFIDLLWSEWQRRNPDQAATSPNAQLRGFAVQESNKVSDFQDIRALGHEYELNETLKSDLLEDSAPPIAGPFMTLGSLAPLFPGTLQDRFAEVPHADFAVPSLVVPTRRTMLVLKGVAVPKVASFTLYVYVHPRRLSIASLAGAERRAYYVGYVSMWKAHAHTSHDHTGHGTPLHPASANARLDATAVFGRLQASGELDLVATLDLQPAPVLSGAAASLQELVREIEIRDFALEIVQ